MMSGGIYLAPHNLWLSCPEMVACGETIRVTLVYGHYFEPQGDVREAAAKIWAVNPDGEIRSLEITAGSQALEASLAVDRPGVWTVLASYDAGLWAVFPDGRHLPGGRQVNPTAGAVRDCHYRKYAKTLVVCDKAGHMWPSPVGTEIEITPLGLGEGSLTLSAQLNGHPLPRARVFAACRGRKISRLTRTDKNGQGILNLGPGTWLIVVDHELAPGEPERESYANLQATYSLTI